MNLKGIDHIGVAVQDLDEAEELLGGFGLSVGDVVKLPDVEGRFYPAGGDASIELVQFFDDEERGRRLGEGAKGRIDHIAFGVDDLEAILPALEALGIELTGPPRRTDGAVSVWTKAPTSGGVMFQFIQRDRAPE